MRGSAVMTGNLQRGRFPPRGPAGRGRAAGRRGRPPRGGSSGRLFRSSPRHTHARLNRFGCIAQVRRVGYTARMRQLVPGSEVAGYRIESLVGRGGMGVVYGAMQLRLERVVALKVIAPELLDDEGVRERFLAEARAAAS